MNQNILTKIDKALSQTEPSTSPTTDHVVEALTRSRKIFQPEVLRNKKLVGYSDDLSISAILKGKSAGPEKSFAALRDLQSQFEAVIKQFDGVSTTAANAKHRKQSSDAREQVATTGEVPENFSVKSLEEIHETFRTARGALTQRAKAITAQAAVLASPIRATALNLVTENAKALEKAERATAASFSIAFEPSELLRAHWSILIRNAKPITKPGALTSPRAMLAGIVNI